MSRILVIEDQLDIAELVRLHLSDLGHEVAVAHDGLAGLEGAAQADLIVLDVMLPKMDGLDVLKRLRQQSSQIPVLMLTARASEIDRVVGLELGADDYLAKPFSIPELQARVKALLRRASISQQVSAASASKTIENKSLQFDSLKINLKARHAHLDDKDLQLTTKEFDLLVYFARHPGRVFTRVQLLEAVWSTTYEGYELTVNTHINRLRAKLELDPAKPSFIHTVRGVGYRFLSE